jgi:hypothetical protein
MFLKHRMFDGEKILRQGWNGLFEPEVGLSAGRRVVTARLCAQIIIVVLDMDRID